MQKRCKWVYSAFVLSLLSLGVMGGVVVYSQKREPQEIKIGITIYDGEDPFIHNTKESVLKNLEKLEAETGVKIMAEVADSDHDQQLQNDQIDRFIEEGYDLLVVNSVDRAEAATIIDKAKIADIPVIFYNREPVPQDMEKWEKVYYVGSKAEEAGALQGEMLADALDNGLTVDTNQDGKIQYVMLEGEYGHQDAILRTYHCIRVLEERGYVMDNLATDTGMWRKDLAKEKLREWQEQFGDQIEVVLSNNDEMALGAISLLEEKGYFEGDHWVPILGVDGIDEAIRAIGEGKLLGTVYNDWEAQARCITSQISEIFCETKQLATDNILRDGNYFWVKHRKVTGENLDVIKNHTINTKK